MSIQAERLYDGARRGTVFLVERLWPRGVAKQALAGATWCRDVAPSTALRQWYGHRPERWPEFRRRYRSELEQAPEALEPLVDAARAGDVTLLYSAKDRERNSAVVLAELLRERVDGQRTRPAVRREE